MCERKPDAAVCISLEEYKDLVATHALYEELRHQYWMLKSDYDELLKRQKAQPTFGKMEDDDEANS